MSRAGIINATQYPTMVNHKLEWTITTGLHISQRNIVMNNNRISLFLALLDGISGSISAALDFVAEIETPPNQIFDQMPLSIDWETSWRIFHQVRGYT
mgnify:CR=1 FL=1